MSGLKHLKGKDLHRESDPGWESCFVTGELTGAKQLIMATFKTGPGLRIPSHHHTCDTIAYLVRGRAAFVSGDDRTEMAAGDFIYVPAGVVHEEETIGDETAEFVLARDGVDGETIPADPEDPFWDQ